MIQILMEIKTYLTHRFFPLTWRKLLKADPTPHQSLIEFVRSDFLTMVSFKKQGIELLK